MPRDLAAEYERLHPETGISEAQKEERMQRLAFKDERRALRRTNRTRGIVVPAAAAFDDDGRLRP